MTRILSIASLLLLAASTLARAETCRHALVLALDVSGSVNEIEYADQITGLAAALNAPDVRQLILADPAAPIHLATFVWSSRNHQTLVHGWRVIDNDTALNSVIGEITGFQRRRAGLKTALGTALGFGAQMLDSKRHCWKRTIDVSGDGPNNIGPTPQDVYPFPSFNGITVNALVVGDPNPEALNTSDIAMTRPELDDYYQNNVIRGPGAFSIIAWGYSDYARAMREKLLKELELPVLGNLD